MGLLARRIGLAVDSAIREQLIPKLDQYHQLWAEHNRTTESRLAALEEAAALWEQQQNGYKLQLAELVEQAERLYHRVRMRYVREGPPPQDEGDLALLRRKGIS